ncbi:MAG: transglycosylase family protein [Acidimicrobiales bacterium]
MPVDGLVGFRTPPRVTDAPRADAPRLARERRPLFRATRPTSGNGRFHVSIRDVVIEREAQNLTRLAAAVRFADAVALSELAHAVAVDRLAGAYQAFQAAAAAQRAQSAAAAVAAAPAPAPAIAAGGPAAGGVWAALRQCESGGNYAEDSGNGYYGAYQFSLGTWESLGYGGLPSSAPPAVQDAAAQALQARSGWGQWPVCSLRIGM